MEEVGGGGYSQTYATGMYHPPRGKRGGKSKEKLRNMVLCKLFANITVMDRI